MNPVFSFLASHQQHLLLYASNTCRNAQQWMLIWSYSVQHGMLVLVSPSSFLTLTNNTTGSPNKFRNASLLHQIQPKCALRREFLKHMIWYKDARPQKHLALTFISSFTSLLTGCAGFLLRLFSGGRPVSISGMTRGEARGTDAVSRGCHANLTRRGNNERRAAEIRGGGETQHPAPTASSHRLPRIHYGRNARSERLLPANTGASLLSGTTLFWWTFSSQHTWRTQNHAFIGYDMKSGNYAMLSR